MSGPRRSSTAQPCRERTASSTSPSTTSCSSVSSTAGNDRRRMYGRPSRIADSVNAAGTRPPPESAVSWKAPVGGACCDGRVDRAPDVRPAVRRPGRRDHHNECPSNPTTSSSTATATPATTASSSSPARSGSSWRSTTSTASSRSSRPFASRRRPRLPDHEWGSAASEAYLRVIAMGTAFRNREIGRFYAALVTCVQNSCRDFGRKELRHDKRAAGSVDSTFEPDGEGGPYDAALAAHDQRLREQAGDALDAEHSRVEAEQLVAWGISQIANNNYREVLEMTWIHKLSPPMRSPTSSASRWKMSTPVAVAAAKNWRRSSVTFDRDRILSEFIDAWNAGSRPDVDDYLARAPATEQGELADQLLSFLTFAPTPSYDDDTLAAIRAEPICRGRARGDNAARRAAAQPPDQPARALLDDDAAAREQGRRRARTPERQASRRPPPTSNGWNAASWSPRASRDGSSTRSPACSRSPAASSRAPATSVAGCPPGSRSGPRVPRRQGRRASRRRPPRRARRRAAGTRGRRTRRDRRPLPRRALIRQESGPSHRRGIAMRRHLAGRDQQELRTSEAWPGQPCA